MTQRFGPRTDLHPYLLLLISGRLLIDITGFLHMSVSFLLYPFLNLLRVNTINNRFYYDFFHSLLRRFSHRSRSLPASSGV